MCCRTGVPPTWSIPRSTRPADPLSAGETSRSSSTSRSRAVTPGADGRMAEVARRWRSARSTEPAAQGVVAALTSVRLSRLTGGPLLRGSLLSTSGRRAVSLERLTYEGRGVDRVLVGSSSRNLTRPPAPIKYGKWVDRAGCAVVARGSRQEMAHGSGTIDHATME